MTDPTAIDKNVLSKLFADLASKARYTYALLCLLPKENCYIFRSWDGAARLDGEEHPEQNTFSIQEFLATCDSLHPEDEFGIFFFVHLDRIETQIADQYTDSVDIGSRRDATVSEIQCILAVFLKYYCEKCLRDNLPLELTPEAVARYALTADDRDKADKELERHNTAAKNKIRAEYDALRSLDFIRE